MVSLFPSLTRTRIITSAAIRLGSTVVFLLLGLSILRSQSVSAQSTTQTLSLDAGWNLVSLRVQPDDASLDSIFGSNVDSFHMVKNAEGRAYIPSEGIKQLNTWAVDESYRVYVESAVTLNVSGTAVSAGSTPVVLEEGGNLVPYFASIPLASEAAFRSIKSSLARVESKSGEIYDPDASTVELDSLRPSQGYKVYTERRDTLKYPIVVPTLAEAKSLESVEVGRTIRVQGYDEPGDGGGGFFQATESACETDGGTCFLFDEDESTTRSYTFDSWPTWIFPHANIEWESLEIKYGPDDNDVIGSLGLHGHTRGAKNQDWLDLKNGKIVSGGVPIRALNEDLGYGDPGNQGFTATYRFATSDRRLERIGVTDAVSIEWWGPPRADPNNPETAGRELAWAINAAAKLYENGSMDWAYVNIPHNYYYKHLYKIRNGVKLRGTGTDRSVPGESWTTNGALTMMPGEAMYTWHVNYDPVAEHDERGIMEGGKNGATQFFTNEYMASKIGIEDLKMNGNLENNQQVFDSQGQYDNLINRLQNASDWTAFYTSGAGSLVYEDRMRFEIDQLNSVGFGGNNLGGNGIDVDTPEDEDGAAFEVYSENVRLQDAVRNHQVYSMPGPKKENWSIERISWAGPAKVGSKNHRESNFTNLEIKNIKTNPWFNDRGVFNAIGKNVTIDGFLVDMTSGSAQRTRIWSDPWGNNVYKDGTIKLSPEGNISWINRFRFGLPTKFKNITVEDYGGAVVFASTFNRHGYNYIFDNITVDPQDGVGSIGHPSSDDWSIGTIFGLELQSPITSVGEPTKETLGKAERNEFRQFEYNRKFGTRAFTFNEDDANTSGPFHPYDLFFVDSKIRNSPSTTISFLRIKRTETDAAVRASRLYWDNMTFNVPTHGANDTFHKWARPRSILRMRDSQDREGRTSDASGTYTSDPDDEGNNHVLIPTNLVTRAWERSATVASGNRTVQSVEIANSDGTIRADDNKDEEDPYLKVNLDEAIQSGNTIEVDWAARVTPLDDFSTTGLFVSRPVPDKDYASGDGPWQIDLRGVAASQESREKIVYTASSDDTSVLSANMQEDDYTLELTGQGTGTTTVMVTGSINGVGTAIDTFEVTVE